MITRAGTAGLLLLFILVSASVARGETKVSFSASPVFMSGSGSTDYTIQALTYVVSEDLSDTTLVGIRSKLEFPLDVYFGGGDFRWDIGGPGKKGWTINLKALIGLSNPGDKMEDHDWFTDLKAGIERKWSWTESRAELNYLLLRLDVATTVAQSGRNRLALLAGFKFNRQQWDMYGFDGWQLTDTNRISGGGHVLYYRAAYKLPFAGVRLNLGLGHSSAAELEVAAGRLLASDLDDHLLRGKTAEASTSGWAFVGRFEGKVRLAQRGSRRYFLKALVDLSRQSASGSQTQKWYKDEIGIDPDTGEEVVIAEKGTVVAGIDYETTSRQLRFGVGIGVEF